MAINYRFRIVILIILALLIVLLSGNVAAQGPVSNRDIVRFGNDITVPENEVVKDVTAIAGSVTISNNAHVTGDAVAVGGDVTLKTGAKVDGDVTAVGGEISQEKDVMIGGNAVTVTGDIDIIQGLRQWGFWGLLGHIYLISAAFYSLFMIAVAIIGMALMLIMPGFMQSISIIINRKPLKSFTWGVGGAITFLLLVILTSGSLLGNLLIPIAALIVGLVELVGINAISLFLGEKALKNNTSPILQLLLGVIVIGVITLIPVVGVLVFLVLTLFGFGGVLASPLMTEQTKFFWHNKPQLTPSKSIEDPRQEVI
ncbi:hypothetical protein [Mastigocoleus sp. MO_188.B34]|uniref:hypothetical protein n=1 Tax=Mastigocoleus sp. MO_188.B34 TaxID=3036635 RepID=UPI002639BC41|nr:hypothetical protein [Mastigocoleus sp. MO_188.B34]MDJ0696908.1 hypothetical protein [Mastigocoleus sp. MO_188.B34]